MKKGLIKYLSIVVMSFALIMTPISKLNAVTGSISVKSNKSTAVVGSTINITVTISAKEALGTWDFTLSYDTSKLKLLDADPRIVGWGDGNTKSKSYTFSMKVLAKGTSSVSVKSYAAYPMHGEETPISLSAGSVRITAITQAELEASYSKNNNLKDLGVEGYSLSTEFNKDTTEYSVNVPSDIEKVTLTGSPEDAKASISGLGEFEVSEGENKFDIIVTAENGSQKTYTLKVNVLDENPIEVVIDGLKYTVVKRGSTLTPPSTFEATTQIINGVEVPAFKSNITGFTLVGLKSSEGEPNLYIYDEEKTSYTLYKELKTEGILLFPTTSDIAPEYYKKTKITINGEDIEAYQYDGVEDYYLVYGINIETGAEGFYQYDMVNNTITRYNDKIIKELTERNENFLMIIITLGVETIVMILILLITIIKRNKTSKNKSKKTSFKDFDKELNEPIKEKTSKNKEPELPAQNNLNVKKEENKEETKKNKKKENN